MNKLEKQKYVNSISSYFSSHDIHGFFATLYTQLLRAKPADPLAFLIDFIRSPKRRKLYIVGTPGCDTKKQVLQLSEHLQIPMISMGDLLLKEVAKNTEAGQQLDYFLANGLYAPDELVVGVLEKYLAQQPSGRGLIIEGFPKTVYQAKFLVLNNLFQDVFIKVDFPPNQALSGIE